MKWKSVRRRAIIEYTSVSDGSSWTGSSLWPFYERKWYSWAPVFIVKCKTLRKYAHKYMSARPHKPWGLCLYRLCSCWQKRWKEESNIILYKLLKRLRLEITKFGIVKERASINSTQAWQVFENLKFRNKAIN